MDRFNKIYSDNYRLIFNVVRKMVPDREDASDLVQEVFIELYQGLKKKPIEYPRSWLYKVTVNRCIDYSKRKKKHEKIELVKHLKDGEDPPGTSEDQRIIRLALSRLKKDESILAILYSEGLSYKEMAEITGMRFSSVGKTLSRTLKKLGNELKKLQYELY